MAAEIIVVYLKRTTVASLGRRVRQWEVIFAPARIVSDNMRASLAAAKLVSQATMGCAVVEIQKKRFKHFSGSSNRSLMHLMNYAPRAIHPAWIIFTGL